MKYSLDIYFSVKPEDRSEAMRLRHSPEKKKWGPMLKHFNRRGQFQIKGDIGKLNVPHLNSDKEAKSVMNILGVSKYSSWVVIRKYNENNEKEI